MGIPCQEVSLIRKKLKDKIPEFLRLALVGAQPIRLRRGLLGVWKHTPQAESLEVSRNFESHPATQACHVPTIGFCRLCFLNIRILNQRPGAFVLRTRPRYTYNRIIICELIRKPLPVQEADRTTATASSVRCVDRSNLAEAGQLCTSTCA